MISLAQQLAPEGFAGMRPWQLVFVVVGAPGLLLAAIIYLTVGDPRQHVQTGRPVVPFGAVLRFLRNERAVFVPHMLGFTFMAMALYAVLGWSPAWLMRRFALDPSVAGIWLGVIAILAGGGGVLASGWIMDRFVLMGRRDAPFATGMIGSIGAILPAAALPFAPSLEIGALLLTIALFFASFPMAPSTAVMQILAPPAMRSRVAAIFLCISNFIGLALGSLLVGLLNDKLFASASATGSSMAIVTVGAATLAALLLATGRRSYARAVAALDGENPQ